MTLAGRITGSITRAQALDLIATLATELANTSGDRIPVSAEFSELRNDETAGYFGIGNYGTFLASAAIAVPDPS